MTDLFGGVSSTMLEQMGVASSSAEPTEKKRKSKKEGETKTEGDEALAS